MKKMPLVGLIVATLAVFAYAATRTGSEKPVPLPYMTAPVDRGIITHVITATGTVEPVSAVSVGTQVSGTVIDRYVDFNTQVKRGQVLLKLDPTTHYARVRQALAQQRAAEASVTLAVATLGRNEHLVQQGFISGLALDQSRRELQSAQANFDAAKAQVDAATADVANCVIRSPIDGVVIKRTVDIGQTVAASFQTPELFQLAPDLKHMRIHVNVSEADVASVKTGQAVRFSVDAYPDREFDGTVEQVRLGANQVNGMVVYTVVVAVDNPDERLKLGMTAQTRIVVETKRDVMRIPTAALRFRPDESEILAAPSAHASQPAAGTQTGFVSDGALHQRSGPYRLYSVYSIDPEGKLVGHEVLIGVTNNRYTEIKGGGVKPGDLLVIRRRPTEGDKP